MTPDSNTTVQMKDVNSFRPAVGNHIRVVLPPRVLYDQKQLNRLVGELTGHTGCHSGFSIEFLHAHEYRINPATERLETF